MNKYILAVATAVLYMACVSWIIHSEGVAYRRSLREARGATRPVAKAVPSPVLPEEKKDRPPIAEAPAAPPDAPATAGSPAPPVASSSPAPAEPAAPAGSAPLASKPAEPAAPGGAPDRTAGAPDPNRDPIWDEPAQKKVWDLSKLSAADEMLLGRDLHDLIVRLNPPLREGPWLRRVEEAAEPLLAARERKEIKKYTFTILDSNEVNAFSHPGGYIYISRGLFDLIGEDEDYALMFVIAHEIAHVDRQHALACLADPEVQKLGQATSQLFYGLIFPWGYYPDEMDHEADRWAFDQLIRLDYSVRESLAFLRKFEGYAENHKFYDGRDRPRGGPNISLVDNHFRAHPAAWRRRKELEKLPAAAPVTPAAARPPR